MPSSYYYGKFNHPRGEYVVYCHPKTYCNTLRLCSMNLSLICLKYMNYSYPKLVYWLGLWYYKSMFYSNVRTYTYTHRAHIQYSAPQNFTKAFKFSGQLNTIAVTTFLFYVRFGSLNSSSSSSSVRLFEIGNLKLFRIRIPNQIVS